MKKLVKDNKVSLLMLAEPKIIAARYGKISQKTGFKNFVSNEEVGGTWI